MDATDAIRNLCRALHVAAALALLRLGFTPSDLVEFASIRGYVNEEWEAA